MISTVDRYVLGRILRTFVPTALGLCFVFFVGASFRLLREEDLSLEQIVMALPWVVPFLLPYLIPMAFVTTLTLVYGRLEADNEVLAFGSLGIPSRALAWPALLLAAVLSLGLAWLTAQVVPYCHQKKREAARAVFQQLFTLGSGEHWSRTFPKQGFDLYVRRYAPGKLEGIVIHYEREAGKRSLPVQLVAREGRIDMGSGTQRLVLVLTDVTATLGPRREPVISGARRKPLGEDDGPVRVHLDRYVQAISLGGRRRAKAVDYTSADLRAISRDARRRGVMAGAIGGARGTWVGFDDRGIESEIELAMRASMSLAPILMCLLVVPLTFLLRARSPLVPFAVGLVAVTALFFAPLLLGRSLAETLGVGAVVYLGCGVALLAGGALVWGASRI